MKQANALIHESSPYLQQHAYNPVNWVAWSDDIFERAKKENKMVLVSVGYSACHWCHVMEHESFENEEVANIMNAHFINVKVDREERPDVDQVYMTAVQLMTQRGGWPLNCITLPDGRPIYGGTYFPKDQWTHILQSLNHLFVNDLQKAEEYASQLHEGILKSELISKPEAAQTLEIGKVHELVTRWKKQFDFMEGGNARAPKFPLPNNIEFLMRYAYEFNDETIAKHVELTLDKMALGGIYDQVGGGFTRYSVDMLWKVPHFEKMLYDNGQLLSLYSNAYKLYQKPLYKRIVKQTIEWLKREMQHEEGAFFAALDADSEGEEGKFYCWSLSEYKEILDSDFQFAMDLYAINARGYWEEEKYIPLRTSSDHELCTKWKLSLSELEQKIQSINEKLLSARKKRVRPSTDDKLLTSWNALLVNGLCDAYAAFGDEEYKHMAHKIVRWIASFQLKEDHSLWRTRKNGVSKIGGFLEDYATVISAFLRYYEVSGDEKYALLAFEIQQFTQSNFLDSTSRMYFFTPADSKLIARKMDVNDNVIPASNSIMATNLWKLAHLFEKSDWKADSLQQLSNVYEGMEMYGSGYSNWALLLLNATQPYYEVVITGELNEKRLHEWHKEYHPHVLTAFDSEKIALGKHKNQNENFYYVCSEKTGCLPPVRELHELLEML